MISALVGLIPPWFKWVALGLVAGSLVMAGERWGAGRIQAKWDAEKAATVAQALQASQEARRVEQSRARNVQESQDHARKIAEAARVDAAGARDELGRLRDELAARDRVTAVAAGAKCVVDVGAAERKLLGACAAEYQRMAEEADGVRANLIELQGYVKALGVTEAKP
jgi:hypothetical protein